MSEVVNYAGRSAQKIISRARCNPLARTCQSPRTKLVGRLARFVLQVARISHPLHENPNSSWGGISYLAPDKTKGRWFLPSVFTLSRGRFETVFPFFSLRNYLGIFREDIPLGPTL